MKNILSRSILSVALATSTGIVHSAVLEEIVVTAQQRAESLFAVSAPVSIRVLSSRLACITMVFSMVATSWREFQ